MELGRRVGQYVWAFAHGLYGVGAMVLVVHLCGLGLFSMLWLGSVGNDLAWRHCHFASYEEFTRKQQYWTNVGIWITVIPLLLVVAATIFAIIMINRRPRRGGRQSQRTGAV